MKGTIMRKHLALIFLLLALFASSTFAQKRNFTEKDLFNFIWAGDPQVSPDSSRVAFVRVTVNEKKDGYNTAIWTVSPATGETHQLTTGPRDSAPR
jgi:dipeptidyl aminopeptidase/acylaminoacyl peptidase